MLFKGQLYTPLNSFAIVCTQLVLKYWNKLKGIALQFRNIEFLLSSIVAFAIM